MFCFLRLSRVLSLRCPLMFVLYVKFCTRWISISYRREREPSHQKKRSGWLIVSDINTALRPPLSRPSDGSIGLYVVCYSLTSFPPTSKQEALVKSKEKLSTMEAQCSALTEQRGFLEKKLVVLRKHMEKVQRWAVLCEPKLTSNMPGAGAGAFQITRSGSVSQGHQK